MSVSGIVFRGETLTRERALDLLEVKSLVSGKLVEVQSLYNLDPVSAAALVNHQARISGEIRDLDLALEVA